MIPTLEQILARCDVDRRNHVLWQGKMTRGRNPRWTFEGKDVNVRRAAYEYYHGITLGPAQLVGTCRDWRCLAKKCLHLTTKSEAAKRGYASMRSKKRHHKAVVAAQKQRRILDDDKVRLARKAPSPTVVAQFLGCSVALVKAIRQRRRYADVPDFAPANVTNHSDRR